MPCATRPTAEASILAWWSSLDNPGFHSIGRAARRAWLFMMAEFARGRVQKNKVGEGPANVDTDPNVHLNSDL